MIVGIDEVGRGPWAGPLVVGAVALNGAKIDGLADSKKLTKRRRERLYEELINSDASIGLGWVHADELDRIGLSRSLVIATKRAIAQITTAYDSIVIDGTVNFLKDIPKGNIVAVIPKADASIPSVSAASIVAKVTRDTYMSEQSTLYPGYGFASHVGYGTAAHRAAIDAYGLTPLHRRSFASLGELEPAAKARS
jgi:ribonuclease HII